MWTWEGQSFEQTRIFRYISLVTIIFGGQCLYLWFDVIFKSWPPCIRFKAPTSGTSTRGHLQRWTVGRNPCFAVIGLTYTGVGWSCFVFKWGFLWSFSYILLLIWPYMFCTRSFKLWRRNTLFQSMVTLNNKLTFRWQRSVQMQKGTLLWLRANDT